MFCARGCCLAPVLSQRLLDYQVTIHSIHHAATADARMQDVLDLLSAWPRRSAALLPPDIATDTNNAAGNAAADVVLIVRGPADAATDMPTERPCTQLSIRVGDSVANVEESEKSLLKSVDRGVEKLARVYRGQVCMLLDVVRDCIVVDEIKTMHRILKLMVQDQEIQLLRVNNRMSQHYNSRDSCGYRDVLINFSINTPLTRQLGLSAHVCEVQIILKRFMVHKSENGHKRYVDFRNTRCI